MPCELMKDVVYDMFMHNEVLIVLNTIWKLQFPHEGAELLRMGSGHGRRAALRSSVCIDFFLFFAQKIHRALSTLLLLLQDSNNVP